MRKLMLVFGAAAALALSAFGCAHERHEARADYEHDRARHEAHEGHLVGAARDEARSHEERHRADETRY